MKLVALVAWTICLIAVVRRPVRASEQAQDRLSPTKNKRDKQFPSWRNISCHSDKNRYSDIDAALVLSTVSCFLRGTWTLCSGRRSRLLQSPPASPSRGMPAAARTPAAATHLRAARPPARQLPVRRSARSCTHEKPRKGQIHGRRLTAKVPC